MKKTVFFYLFAFLLLLLSFLYFNRAYKEMVQYAELVKRGNTIYVTYQTLSKNINNAAIVTPDLSRITDSSSGVKLFFTDSLSVTQQLASLKFYVKDSINVMIANELDSNINTELAWLLKSNVPDSILLHKGADHVRSFQNINKLIDQGLKRTTFIVDYSNRKLDIAFNKMKVLMIVFILLSGILLFYTAVNIVKQKAKNEKRFRSLVERNDDIIAMLDKNMIPFYRSPSAERLTGYTFEERKNGQNIAEVHPDDQIKINECLAEIKSHPGKAIPVTYRLKHKKGHYIWLEGTFTDLTHDADVAAIVANMRDVTKRLEAQKELNFLNEVLEKRVLDRTEKLLNANKELEQFAFVASHDLQEPLRKVSNYMKVFEEDYLDKLDDKAVKYLQSVNNATKRMSVLIKSLLDFSRLGYNAKLTNSDFKIIIDEVITDLDSMIESSAARITVSEMPKLNVYESEIRQVFQNLITNAIKFKRKNDLPQIRISSEKINGVWNFFVSDNGIGIEQQFYEKAFNIFQRLETEEIHEGSGIGLAKCKKIIQLHKGEIWIESNPAQGSTFHFTIANLIS